MVESDEYLSKAERYEREVLEYYKRHLRLRNIYRLIIAITGVLVAVISFFLVFREQGKRSILIVIGAIVASINPYVALTIVKLREDKKFREINNYLGNIKDELKFYDTRALGSKNFDEINKRLN